MFVYQADYPEAFFVETKEPPERLRNNQRFGLQIIEKYLGSVYIAEIVVRTPPQGGLG